MELLLISAFTIGALHSLAPDHWMPFVALARAQQWNKWKITCSVFLAGLGHVSSSVVIGLVGITIGAATEHVSGWETVRGDVASLLLIGFGIAYMIYGLKQIGKRNAHVHDKAQTASYWTLFILIMFGPCEPLIPLLFASSAFGWPNVIAAAGVFGAATLIVMQLQVHVALWGISYIKVRIFEHTSDVLAGAAIVVTGIAIRVFGI